MHIQEEQMAIDNVVSHSAHQRPKNPGKKGLSQVGD